MAAIRGLRTGPFYGPSSPIQPWQEVASYIVGGLFQVGFAPDSDFAMVLSHDGRGIFDCLSGDRAERDDGEPWDAFDPIHLTAQGFGVLARIEIRMAGLFGGGLPLTTWDHYGVEIDLHLWPNHNLLFRRPDGSKLLIEDNGICELFATGFSESGRSLVIATSCNLTIFSRGGEMVPPS